MLQVVEFNNVPGQIQRKISIVFSPTPAAIRQANSIFYSDQFFVNSHAYFSTFPKIVSEKVTFNVNLYNV
jgi:hypothetical protein